MFKFYRICLCFIWSLLWISNVSLANIAKAQKTEIQYLLSQIKQTPCIVKRNEVSHKGEEVYSHVLKKFEYYQDQIQSTEDFIRLSASKSTFSGKNYRISCDQKNWINTKDWLLEKLNGFRREKNR